MPKKLNAAAAPVTAAGARKLAKVAVHGAYGGPGLFAPSVRHKYDDIEHADSFILDPHKWLFAPFDCAALLYREPALARAVQSGATRLTALAACSG